MKTFFLFLLTCMTACAQIVLSGNSSLSGNVSFFNYAASVPDVSLTGNLIRLWTNSADASGGTIAATVSSPVPGRLYVVWVKAEYPSGTPTISSVSDGTTSFNQFTLIRNASIPGICQAFYLTNVSSGATAITATFSASCTWRRIIVGEFETSSLAVADTFAGTTGSSTTPNSGNITTAGKGLVFGFYGEGTSAHYGKILIGTNGALAMPFDEPAYVSRMWVRQTQGAETNLSAATTLVSSGQWMAGIAAFKGSGSYATGTGTNYAQLLLDMTNQTTAAAMTTTILSNGLRSPFIPTWTMYSNGISVAPANNIRVGDPKIYRRKPVVVGGLAYATNITGKSLEFTNSVNYQSARFATPKSKDAVVSGSIVFGVPGGAGAVYDMVKIHTDTGPYAILQLIDGGPTYGIKLHCDTNTTSAQAITAGTTNYFSMRADMNASVGYLTMWDSAGTQLFSVTANSSPGGDIDYIEVGNQEVGTATGANYFQDLMVDFMGASPYPMIP